MTIDRLDGAVGDEGLGGVEDPGLHPDPASLGPLLGCLFGARCCLTSILQVCT